jgi:hypothetical protein
MAVFSRQRMDEQQRDTPSLRACMTARSNSCCHSRARGPIFATDTPNSAQLVQLGIDRERQVRHGNQFERRLKMPNSSSRSKLS